MQATARRPNAMGLWEMVQILLLLILGMVAVMIWLVLMLVLILVLVGQINLLLRSVRLVVRLGPLVGIALVLW